MHEGFALLREHGLLSMLVPEELGGGGASHADACAVLAVLAHGCPATSLAFAMHTHLVAAQVWRHHRGLPAPVLEKVAAQQVVLVSTGAADWLDSSGTAVRVEGGYRVSGRKMPSSGAPAGNVLATSIRWDDAPDGPQVLHLSIPFAADGVSIDETWDTMGMRATGSHTVVLDDVFVPDASVALTRPAGVWHPVWATVIGAAMPLIMSTYVGVAEAATERATMLAMRRAERPDVAAGRGAHGQPAGTGARRRAGHDRRERQPALRQLTRRCVVDVVPQDRRGRCGDRHGALALEVGGGAAYSRSSGIERLFRDVHGALYHPLPAAQQESFTGRLALGLDPIAPC